MDRFENPPWAQHDVEGTQPRRAIHEPVRFAYADHKDGIRITTDFGYPRYAATTSQIEAFRSIPRKIQKALGTFAAAIWDIETE